MHLNMCPPSILREQKNMIQVKRYMKGKENAERFKSMLNSNENKFKH